MAEESIWKGTSSQWKNFNSYALCCATVVLAAFSHWKWQVTWVWFIAAGTAGWAFWKWLVLKNTSYELTNERLVTTQGILTKVTDTLELYRVRDIQVVQPLLLRILRLKNIRLIAADVTSGQMQLDYLPRALDLGEQLRRAVEACRERKRVRALDVVNDSPGDLPPDTTL
jgi:uncharacterized membrane protein YdbT with pleckstrin-like domain